MRMCGSYVSDHVLSVCRPLKAVTGQKLHIKNIQMFLNFIHITTQGWVMNDNIPKHSWVITSEQNKITLLRLLQ